MIWDDSGGSVGQRPILINDIWQKSYPQFLTVHYFGNLDEAWHICYLWPIADRLRSWIIRWHVVGMCPVIFGARSVISMWHVFNVCKSSPVSNLICLSITWWSRCRNNLRIMTIKQIERYLNLGCFLSHIQLIVIDWCKQYSDSSDAGYNERFSHAIWRSHSFESLNASGFLDNNISLQNRPWGIVRYTNTN